MTVRARLYHWSFRHYRRAPFNSRRGDFWWWLGRKIESEVKPIQEYRP